MSSWRYMFYVSYMGNRFAGSQYQPTALSVQGVFNNALALVLNVPSKLIKTTSCSRTDSGVHAMRNAYGLDISEDLCKLARPRDDFFITNKLPYDANELTLAMNHILFDLNVDARILGGRVVSDGFCVRRHTKSRTYLYRLAVMKPEFGTNDDDSILKMPLKLAPLIEKSRCWFVGSNFNYENFFKSSKMFVGEHDFSCFSATSNITEARMSTIRTIGHVCVDVGRPLLDPKFEPLSNCFDFFDITINAKSFLYRQIRRMVGAMVAVAQGKINLEDVKWLLDHPNNINWSKYDINMAPPFGLYLQDIDYNPKDFDDPQPYYTARNDDDSSDDPSEINDTKDKRSYS